MKKFVTSGFITESKFILKRISLLICINLIYLTAGFSQLDETYLCKHHHKAIFRRPTNFERSLSLAAQNADFLFHECKWQIDPAVRYISGSVFTKFKALTDIDQLSFDLSSALTVDSVLYNFNGNTTSLAFAQVADLLECVFPHTIAEGMTDSVLVYYQGVPPNTGFGSFNLGTHGSPPIPVLWTLSEPYGARDWWPCKQTLNDKVDSIRIEVTCPEGYKVASNGILKSVEDLGGSLRYRWTHTYPITAYLVAIAVTNYTHYSENVTIAGKDLPIENYVYPESLSSFQTGTANLLPVMSHFSNIFEPYPFLNEKYGHAQFGWGGGMEHQTMTFVINPGYDLLAHELAHQWFGDKVTCGSWQDIWLNEGFATYLTALTREAQLPGAGDWMAWKSGVINNVTSQNGGSVHVPVADTLNVGRVFNGRLSYNKASFLLHMLRWKIGDTDFFQAIRNYLADANIAYRFARTDDLKTYLEAESGHDLTEFFNDWFYNEGHPVYNIIWYQNSVNNIVQVKINQTQSHSSVSFFEMPVAIKLKNVPLNKDTIVILNHLFDGQIFTFPLSFEALELEFDPDLWILNKRSELQIIKSNAPLPVFLTLFEGKMKNGFIEIDVELYNSDTRIGKINVEKSSDGSFFKEFSILEITIGKGGYQTIDFNPFPINYYRLRWIDEGTGIVNYSPVIKVSNKDFSKLNVKIFPNPCLQKTNVSIESPGERVVYELTDNFGKILSKGIWENGNIHTLETSNLLPGKYFLNVSTANGHNETVAFVKIGD